MVVEGDVTALEGLVGKGGVGGRGGTRAPKRGSSPITTCLPSLSQLALAPSSPNVSALLVSLNDYRSASYRIPAHTLSSDETRLSHLNLDESLSHSVENR